ncbi:MAG: helicase HerA-like domain-containing protein [Thermoproteus sp. AZ2]|uniref:Helicase HerA-like domain-containing protein n=1 Tax=Thermoproteus sp. AZ2 TaxID=1609232 RepID=A0ACC6V260_9CREN
MSVGDLLARAEEVAKRFGQIIGRVDALEGVVVGEEGSEIAVSIPFEEYGRAGVKIGDLLGISTLMGAVVLARVASVEREHLASALRMRLAFAALQDPAGLATPARLVLEPLTECPADEWDSCEPSSVHTPVDPLSVVFRPGPEFLEKMLGLPEKGVPIGRLYAGGRELEVDVKVPESLLYQHMLIVGTTGSGKTVFMKNLALAILNEARGSTVVALDLQGDYLHMPLPPAVAMQPPYNPPGSITVVLPMSQSLIDSWRDSIWGHAGECLGEADYSLTDVKDQVAFAEAVGCGIARQFVEETYPGAHISEVKVEHEVRGGGEILIREMKGVVEAEGAKFDLRLLPWSLRFIEAYKDIPQIFPILSERVALLFPRIIERMRKTIEARRKGAPTTIYEFVENIDVIENVAKDMSLHPGQRDNVVRSLVTIAETGLLDASYTGEDVTAGPRRVRFGEPDYGSLGGLVVVDLRHLVERPAAASIVVYRVLSKIYEHKDRELKRGQPRPTFLFIDEAHNYFPQARGREEFNKDVVESLINKITRLGRVRRIGVVFATHTPADLNDLIIQLTNTKVAFRSEEQVLERIGLKEAAAELVYAQNGVAVMKSYALRTHTLTIKGYPPMVKHRGHEGL